MNTHPTSAVSAPTTTEILDAEFRMRGSSLEQFASQRGYTLLAVSAMIEGMKPWQPAILLDMREQIGFDPRVS